MTEERQKLSADERRRARRVTAEKKAASTRRRIKAKRISDWVWYLMGRGPNGSPVSRETTTAPRTK